MVLWTLLFGCSGGGEAAPAPGRVDGVAAPKVDQRQLESFCDERAGAAEARPFVIPNTTPTFPAADGWRWVNVWATWCGPCVAEMPMLQKWEKKLQADGVKMDLVFLSVDQTEVEVSRFMERHPGFPVGPRLEGADQLGPWLTAVGLPTDTAIPLHFFVDPEGRTRCVRAGQINPADYPIARALFE